MLADAGDLKQADEYAEISLRILDKFPAGVGSLHSIVMVYSATSVLCKTWPMNQSLHVRLDAHRLGLRTGQTEMSALAILGYSLTYILVGLPLNPLKADLISYEREARRFNIQESVLAVFLIHHQFILNLQEDVKEPFRLKGEAMDADAMLGALGGNSYRMTKRDIDTFRLLLSVFYGCWDAAEMLCDELEPFLGTYDPSTARILQRRTGMALASLNLFRLKGKKKHRAIAKKITKDVKAELKGGNVNAYPFYMMIQAEASPSKEKYDDGIRACARLGLVHFEAYLCERAAEFFLEHNDKSWAQHYMTEAFVLYEDWGAMGKAQQMKREHADLLECANLREKATTSLKGRPRCNSEHVDLLKELNWEVLIAPASSSISSSDQTWNDEDTDPTRKTTDSSEFSSDASSVHND